MRIKMKEMVLRNMRNILLSVIGSIYLVACGGISDNCNELTLNADYVFLQDSVGIHRASPNEFGHFINDAKRFGNEVWSDTEICYFVTGEPFTKSEVKNSIDKEIPFVSGISVYCLSCLNDDNYDERIKAVFIYTCNIDEILTKLQKWDFELIVIQYWHYGDLIDNTELIKSLVENGFTNILVGLDSFPNWYEIITNYYDYALKQIATIRKLYNMFGNQILGIYIPEEPYLYSVPCDLYSYYETVIEYAHSLGYKVGISPFPKLE
jgi:hypothetical protein